jgi:PPIC-type PPIASE domain
MTLLRRILSEPFVHFLAIGAAIFIAYAAIKRGNDTPREQTIVVSAGQIGQIFEVFTRTWQRPPTSDELRGLIDGYVKEEVFYREGRKLGLDDNDTVFRRRLQQKMEFLMEPSAAELTPAEGELEAFLEAHREAFRLPQQLAFEQVFFSPERRGAATAADAAEALKRLRAGEVSDPAELGDPTMLPQRMPLTPADRIELNFGGGFAAGLTEAPVGEWIGPVPSGFGLHLVKVDKKEEARDPPLSEVVGAVTREWEDERRREIADRRYAETLERYTVVVEMPEIDRNEESGQTAPAVPQTDEPGKREAM